MIPLCLSKCELREVAERCLRSYRSRHVLPHTHTHTCIQWFYSWSASRCYWVKVLFLAMWVDGCVCVRVCKVSWGWKVRIGVRVRNWSRCVFVSVRQTDGVIKALPFIIAPRKEAWKRKKSAMVLCAFEPPRALTIPLPCTFFSPHRFPDGGKSLFRKSQANLPSCLSSSPS